MRCPSCAADNPAGKKFCGECGAGLSNRCPKCGAENPAGNKFCGECGTALRGSGFEVRGSSAPATSGHEARLTTEAGERRQLTVLFCDLVGSTELSTQLDAEEWRDVIAKYQRTATGIVERFDGHVAKYLGDGLLALFGYPQAHEDDAERAVRAGLAIVEAVGFLDTQREKTGASRRDRVESKPLSPSSGPSSGPRIEGLRVRVGIHTGPVVVGTGGGDARDVFGETPNIAARVQSAAEPDTVLITGATHRLVSGLFIVEESAPQALKGITTAVALLRVVQASGVRGRIHAAAAASGLTPFVGRTQERQLLRERWELADEGEGQVVLITGEPGIGKSRLVQQFKTDLADTAHSWVEIACSPYLQHTPFAPVAELLQQAFRWSADLPAAERIANVERTLTSMGIEARGAVPLLAPLLGVELPAMQAPMPLTPEEQRQQLMATILAWTLAAARLQPMVLLFEDVQWMDPSTLELLGLLVEQVATATLLIIVTARPELRPPWALRARHAQLTLTRLSRRQTREMLGAVAARALAKTELVEALVSRTDGVPLFVEELARAVLEEESGSPREIPATLHDTLMARLDRLGPVKEVAQVASVLGRDFTFTTLAAMAQRSEAELETALRQLCDAELLYAQGLGTSARYTFKHTLVQEAAYESLLKSRRRELHRRAAAALSTAAGTPAAVLAQHWESAGETERAITAWQTAAEGAQRSAASFEAEAHYRRAINLLATLPDGSERAQRELTLQLSLLQLLLVTRGPYDPAVEEPLARAGTLAEQVGDATQAVMVLNGLWAQSLIRAEARAALTVARKMLEIAERGGSPMALVVAHTEVGFSLRAVGELAAASEHLERALALFNEEDFRSFPLSFAVNALGNILLVDALCGREGARVRHEEALFAAAEHHGAAADLALARVYALSAAAIRRDAEYLGSLAPRLVEYCVEQKLDMFLLSARIYSGLALVAHGRLPEGIALLRESLDQQKAAGFLTLRAFVLSWLIGGHLSNSALPEAAATLDEAFAAIRDEEVWRVELLRLKGDLLRAQCGMRNAESREASPQSKIRNPQLIEAERCYREAIERARAMGAHVFTLRAASHLARFLHTLQRTAEARAVLEPVYASFTEGFSTRDLIEAKALLEELEREI